MGKHRANGLAPAPKGQVSMQNQPTEIVCPCGITFEPLPWHDEDLDEPVCDGCAEDLRS
jgi:hypothetical protein